MCVCEWPVLRMMRWAGGACSSERWGGARTKHGPIPQPPPPIPSPCRPPLLAILATRLLVMPLVGLACVAAGVRARILDPSDRTLLFVLLLEASTPTAMNLSLICEVLGSGTRPLARVLAAAYLASIVSLTVWIAAFLSLISTGALG